ncbi:phosphotransferase family protein [Nonomuraea sp. NPDC049655]|uniref:phosphotransferase family protein n=1 Tax=Nonomuraea sp. NPDC049655 TaxID=3364355 RepID=UPI00379DB6D7
MTRTFLRPDDVRDLVAEQFGADRRPAALDRLTGGSKKGVYRLRLDDATSVILYVWAEGENYWPPSPAVEDDPFTDASGADLFAAGHAALTAADVRVPRLLALDPGGRHLGAALRRMHTTLGPSYGKLAHLADGRARPSRPAEDVVLDRALAHLAAVADRDARMGRAHERIAAHVRRLRDAVAPRERYGLVHGELGPDHVLVTPAGEPVMIDFEGLTYFDAEWEHAWLRMRFEDAYPALRPPALDPDRLELYRYAQVLSLIEGPLRIADTDFPDRRWMLDLAEWNIAKALAVL